jgi:hypothetical protein
LLFRKGPERASKTCRAGRSLQTRALHSKTPMQPYAPIGERGPCCARRTVAHPDGRRGRHRLHKRALRPPPAAHTRASCPPCCRALPTQAGVQYAEIPRQRRCESCLSGGVAAV